jgi:predicted nucleotidyltransferase
MKDIQKMLHPFVEKFGKINQVILFGSRAKGDRQDDSDIDLAIDADIDITQWVQMLLYLDELLNYRVDLVWMQHASEHLWERVRREGIILYEREGDRGTVYIVVIYLVKLLINKEKDPHLKK